jgi:hypothetical protein
MIRECVSNFHKGWRVFGIKRPLLNMNRTSGYCKRCFKLEMKALERREVKRNGKDYIEV